MAITKTLTGAVPYNLDSKVQQWDFTMQYEEGADATYYTSSFNIMIPATDIDGTVNFTPKAEGSWTLAQLTALCPTSLWDTIFDSQYASMVPPPVNPVPDPDYVIPS
jgi:hypothetical protein|tara:strand:- start:65 stop:385 length:321 start_codon:yes stop_codon:yes gene_type:complete